MPIMAPSRGEIATIDGIVSTQDLEAMFEDGRSKRPQRQVLLVGDLATSASMLLPVVNALQQEFEVDKAYGVPFHHAIGYQDGLLQNMAQGSHFLGHGAAAIALAGANLRGLKSATVIAGFETQSISRFLPTFAGLLRRNAQIDALSDRFRPDGISDWHHHLKGREVLYHPLFTFSMIRIAAGISTLDFLASVRLAQDIPAVAVAMANDEYHPVPTNKVQERAARWGVIRRLVSGEAATHDFLLANPTLALTRAEFRSQL